VREAIRLNMCTGGRIELSGRIYLSGRWNRSILSSIEPIFESDPEIGLISPSEPASSDRSKVIERDVKICGKKAYIIRMHSRANLGDLASGALMYPTASAEEQQAVNRLFDHLQPPVHRRAGFGTLRNYNIDTCSPQNSARHSADNPEPNS
jgi:hypothetical protein